MNSRDSVASKRRWVIAPVIFACCLFIGAPGKLDQSDFPGALFASEYGNVAAAIASGQGFSNPFPAVSTGPTAWTAPLLTYVMACVFLLFGVKTTGSFWVLLLLSWACLGWSCWAVDDLLARCRPRLRPAFWVTLLSHLLLNLPWWVGKIQDHALVLLCVALVIRSWRRCTEGREPPYLLGLVLPWVSLQLTLAFLVATVLAAGPRRERKGGISGRQGVYLILMVALSTGLWTARNYVAVGLLAPMKSNLAHELYQSTYETENGLYTTSSVLASHPFADAPARVEFARLGEAKFVLRRRDLLFEKVAQDHRPLLRGVAHRAFNSLVYLRSYVDSSPVNPPLEISTAVHLASVDLVKVEGRQTWISLGLSQNEFVRRLEKLNLTKAQRSSLGVNWGGERVRWLGHEHHPQTFARGLALALLPTLALCLGMASPDVRTDSLFRFVGALYVVYLLPYVLVSHYLRYQLPMILPQAILVSFAWSVVSRRLRGSYKVPILAFLLLFVPGVLSNLSGHGYSNQLFAGEYGNIAAALVRGDGFSDPFQAGTGPTAWMAPLFPVLMALVFLLFGVKSTASLWVLLLLSWGAVAATCWGVDRAAKEQCPLGPRLALWMTLVFYLILNLPWFIRRYHDLWLVMLCLSLSVLACRAWSSGRRWPYLLAALLPLINLQVTLAFFGGLAARLTREQRASGLRALASLVLVATVSTGIWTVRNYLMVGVPAPIKSNLSFELYQSLYGNEQGLYRLSTLSRRHPFLSDQARQEYARLGEADFLAKYRGLAMRKLLDDPGRWFRGLAHRAVNSFVYLSDARDIAFVEPRLKPGEKLALEKRGLLTYNGEIGLWTSLELSPGRFRARLEEADIASAAQVLSHWEAARQRREQRIRSPLGVVAGLSMTLLPSLALLLAFSSPRVRRVPLFRFTAAAYLLYLLPYVLVSHYSRYQIPLIPLQALLVYFGAMAAGWGESDTGEN